MREHFVGFMTYDYGTKKYNEIYIGLHQIISLGLTTLNMEPFGTTPHTTIRCPDEVTLYVKGTPREVIDALYPRLPRDVMTVTYPQREYE